MQPTNLTKHVSIFSNLSEVDKVRLERLALLFNSPTERLTEGCLKICVETPKGPTHVELPVEQAYPRLLAELCSKSARWLYFHPGEHCAVTLLGQTDARLARVADLYRLWDQQGRPP